MDQQIKRDIDRWSDERLRQWFIDSLSRYEMADAGTHEAFCNVTATLVAAAARVLAVSEASPEESAEMFMLLVAHTRQIIARRDKAKQATKDNDR